MPLPLQCASGPARCRQTFGKARSTPSRPRSTSTGVPATSSTTWSPGSASCSTMRDESARNARTPRGGPHRERIGAEVMAGLEGACVAQGAGPVARFSPGIHCGVLPSLGSQAVIVRDNPPPEPPMNSRRLSPVALPRRLRRSSRGRPARPRTSACPSTARPGPCNAITDVAGVTVGQVTLIEDLAGRAQGAHRRHGDPAARPRVARTRPVYGAWFALNGNGEMTGTAWLEESGQLEGPVMLTNTHSVGVVRDAVDRLARARRRRRTPPATGGRCRSWPRPGTAT